jgi:hypothetical protein
MVGEWVLFLWWFTVIGSNGNFNGIWLVVSTYPSEKYFPSSVGTMKFPIYGKIILQTTNQ